MRKVIAACLFLLLTGCQNDERIAEIETLKRQMNEQSQKIAAYEETIQTWKEKGKEKQREIQRLQGMEQRLSTLENQITAMTKIEDFSYEILAESVQGKPETVVYIDGVPPSSFHKRQAYLLLAALHFSYSNYEYLSFWDDKRIAMQYIRGDFDPDQGVLGWPGYDHQFGRIRHDTTPPRLIYHVSRANQVVLEFGKYGIPKD